MDLILNFLVFAMCAQIFLNGANAATSDCTIDINDKVNRPKFKPLYIWPNTEHFIYPNSTDGISRIAVGALIDFYCSTGFETTGLNTNLITAKCVTHKTYSYNDQQFELVQFGCKKHQHHLAQGKTGGCSNGATLVKIGFEVSPMRFLHVMDVCFNEQLKRTHYVKYEMMPANVKYQKSYQSSVFKENGFFHGLDMNKVYSKVSQRDRINIILGSSELAVKYDQEKSGNYMVRGHLAAKNDFIYGAQQRATYNFINAAPQWKSFNDMNWERMEASVRKLVGAYNMTLDVYTGTYGTLTLNNTDGGPVEIHLGVDNNNSSVVPVPKLFYRIIIDRATTKGVALIGVNNPFVTMEDIQREYILCEDVHDQMTVNWVFWNRKNLHEGYGYACDVNQFAAVVKDLPDLKVGGLLFSGAVTVALSGVLRLVCIAIFVY